MKLVFLFPFLFLFLASTSQTIMVISSEDHSPLPYATVTNHSKPYLVSANKEGLAKMEGKPGDTISITYIGYKSVVHYLTSDTLQLVRLIRDAKTMVPITIKTCKTPEEKSFKRGFSIFE